MVNTDTLSRVFLRTEQSGDIASGRVALVYNEGESETTVDVEYDTVQGPDGLSLQAE